MQHNLILVEGARRGDIAALKRLPAACRTDVRQIAHTQCAVAMDAAGAAQESMLLIYRRIGALRKVASKTRGGAVPDRCMRSRSGSAGEASSMGFSAGDTRATAFTHILDANDARGFQDR